MAEKKGQQKKGQGTSTAQKANAKAAKEGKKDPRTSSAAQAELGAKGRPQEQEEELSRPRR